MQRIIDGVLYDTDNALLLYFDEGNGRKYYQTPNRGYFILFPTGEIMVSNREFMQNLLGQYDIQRYIEIFGTPKEG